MPFVRVDDLVVHYDFQEPRAGAGVPPAPVLVFANSLGTDLRVWDPLLPELGGRFRCLRHDQRGHGLSGCTAAPYSIEALARDLAGLLDALGVREAIVCGLSVGGMIAQALATSRPDLVRALVLCDTAHAIGPRAMWEQRMEAVRAGGIEAIAPPVLGRWFSRDFHERRGTDLEGWRNLLVRTPVEGYLGTCAAIRDADLSAQAASIRVPTLCVCGDEDGATPPALVRSLAALIPGARFVLVEGAGHLPCVEQPRTLARAMLEFFAEHRLLD